MRQSARMAGGLSAASVRCSARSTTSFEFFANIVSFSGEPVPGYPRIAALSSNARELPEARDKIAYYMGTIGTLSLEQKLFIAEPEAARDC